MLNWNILAQPLNWLTVVLMIYIAALALHFTVKLPTLQKD